jgi:hypothetical protein
MSLIFVLTLALVAGAVIARRDERPVLWGRVLVVLAAEYLAGAWLGLWPLRPESGPAGAAWRCVVHLLGG